MHTLHFIVIQADSAADAASDVESEIIQWGNENNWRSIGGVASEDGQDASKTMTVDAGVYPSSMSLMTCRRKERISSERLPMYIV
jgi:hypothetical protein